MSRGVVCERLLGGPARLQEAREVASPPQLEKGSGTDLLREMLGFLAQRLMDRDEGHNP